MPSRNKQVSDWTPVPFRQILTTSQSINNVRKFIAVVTQGIPLILSLTPFRDFIILLYGWSVECSNISYSPSKRSWNSWTDYSAITHLTISRTLTSRNVLKAPSPNFRLALYCLLIRFRQVDSSSLRFTGWHPARNPWFTRVVRIHLIVVSSLANRQKSFTPTKCIFPSHGVYSNLSSQKKRPMYYPVRHLTWSFIVRIPWCSPNIDRRLSV